MTEKNYNDLLYSISFHCKRINIHNHLISDIFKKVLCLFFYLNNHVQGCRIHVLNLENLAFHKPNVRESNPHEGQEWNKMMWEEKWSLAHLLAINSCTFCHFLSSVPSSLIPLFISYIDNDIQRIRHRKYRLRHWTENILRKVCFIY